MLGVYLSFNGNCKEALKLYEEAFNAKIEESLNYKDVPSTENFEVKEEMKDWILHSRISICGSTIMCADSYLPTTSSNNTYVSITVNDEELVRKAWEVLKDGAIIYHELAPSFFATAHGSLKDKFGINWMFSALKEHKR